MVPFLKARWGGVSLLNPRTLFFVLFNGKVGILLVVVDRNVEYLLRGKLSVFEITAARHSWLLLSLEFDLTP